MLIFGLFVGIDRFTSRKALNKLLAENEIARTFTYKNFSQPLFGNGLIFYKAKIQALPVEHTIEKMIIHPQKGKTIVQLQNFQIDVIQSLKENYADKIETVLKDYQPFNEALKKPIVSLALSGLETVKGNALLAINHAEKTPKFSGKVELETLATVEFDFNLSEKLTDSNDLSFLLYSFIQTYGVKIQDQGLFTRYINYLKSLKRSSKSKEIEFLRKNEIILNGRMEDNFYLIYR